MRRPRPAALPAGRGQGCAGCLPQVGRIWPAAACCLGSCAAMDTDCMCRRHGGVSTRDGTARRTVVTLYSTACSVSQAHGGAPRAVGLQPGSHPQRADRRDGAAPGGARGALLPCHLHQFVRLTDVRAVPHILRPAPCVHALMASTQVPNPPHRLSMCGQEILNSTMSWRQMPCAAVPAGREEGEAAGAREGAEKGAGGAEGEAGGGGESRRGAGGGSSRRRRRQRRLQVLTFRV